jgi:hypothetical protein
MEENLDSWNHIGEIRRSYDDFVKNLKRLREVKKDLLRDLSPFRTSLIEKRRQLLQKLSPLTNVLAVYIQDHPSGKKIETMVQQRHQLKEYGHTSLLKYAKKLFKLLRKRLGGAQIRRYGLTEDMIRDLGGSIHEFESSLKLKSDLFSAQEKTIGRAEKLIRNNRKLLKRRLDQLLTVFSGTHPGFYNTYRELRDQIQH